MDYGSMQFHIGISLLFLKVFPKKTFMLSDIASLREILVLMIFSGYFFDFFLLFSKTINSITGFKAFLNPESLLA